LIHKSFYSCLRSLWFLVVICNKKVFVLKYSCHLAFEAGFKQTPQLGKSITSTRDMTDAIITAFCAPFRLVHHSSWCKSITTTHAFSPI
jgi:hypothetical protein